MVRATFKFQGNLNDFLAPARRKRSFECVCAESATTKHMIEAFGVPHTEVGTVLVNDEASSLHHLLRDGDRVIVHPITSSVQLHAGASLDDMPQRFLADAHLGGLARLLRMAGFDTFYDNAIHDDELIRIALEEQRIILSRDLELLKRKTVSSGCYIRSLEPAVQMKEVVARFGLARHARPFTLCLHCNLPLSPVEKASVLECLPPSVRQHQNEFSRCACCKRVYWKGTHWQRMQAMLQDLIAGSRDQNTA